MKKLTIDILIVLIGGVIIAATGHMTVFDPGNPADNENTVEIDQLPEPVQETLERDYTGWNPAEATVDRNQDGIFYEVKMNNRTRNETKTVRITIDGFVISEEHKPDNKRRHRERVRYV
jgi:hypothetical protein